MRGVEDLFLAWLRRQDPELLSTSADPYPHGSRTPRHYRDLVRARMNQALQRHRLPITVAAWAERPPLVAPAVIAGQQAA
ncbi:hypothetical protein [Micromonospora rhizosphaerae]|uniref:hypothetical protein n=1 Tax=Micromonospora rhizosphaerae TaxID=568872 RepID=UPI000B810DA0|nr:hypothetical protein [Micromonospora rhizosphaerae]